ncbi:MAG: alpha/beta hydrolase, partial [Luminiphilus sp.]|nr:alpha/beta hydrolase [Luminiphilus sp.]
MKSRLSLMLASITLLVGCAETSLDAEPSYESVVKDDAFRASIDLPSGAAFVELEQGFTYYEAANFDTCDDPIVLVHGFSVPSYIWQPTFEFLSDAGACVLMLDLYGRGLSDNPNV